MWDFEVPLVFGGLGLSYLSDEGAGPGRYHCRRHALFTVCVDTGGLRLLGRSKGWDRQLRKGTKLYLVLPESRTFGIR